MNAQDIDRLHLWHLKQCPLFNALDEKELGAIFHASRIVGVGANEIVPTASDGEPSLWIVKRGHLKLTYVDVDGHSATVLILSPGDIFGSIVQEGAADYGEHCRTITSCCLARMSEARFHSLMQKHPAVAFTLTKSSFQRIHRLQSRLADLMVRPAEARLALVLLELFKQVGETREDGTRVIALPLSHADLAQLIGSSREMVTHVLGRFRRAEWVGTARHEITLLDVAALEVARDVF